MEVAAAIGEKYPDRAFAIYKKHAEAAISRVNPRGYQDGAAVLRHARRVLLKAGRKDEWTDYLAQLRENFARKLLFFIQFGAHGLDPLTGKLTYHVAYFNLGF